MTPLVIGLAIVVVVILIAVAVGMRQVRNTERADSAGRGPGRGGPARDRQPARPGRLQAGPAAAAERAASGPASGRSARRYDGPDHGDDEPDFRTGQRQEARAQARSRQARGKRDDDGDWPSTEWDELSDADYWKEVASDRPLVTTARAAHPGPGVPPAQDGPPARTPPDRRAAGRAERPAGRAADPGRGQDRPREAGLLPARGEPQPAAAGRGHDFQAAPASARGQHPVRPGPSGQWPAVPGLSGPGISGPGISGLGAGWTGQARPGPAGPDSLPGGRRPGPPPADDDPLTSPSFPRVVMSDSRSYHPGRAVAAAPAASPAGLPPDSAPTAQFASCGTGAPRPAAARGGHEYDALAEASSATTAPRAYRAAAQPGTGGYGTRGHSAAGRPAAAGHDMLAGPPQPARWPAPATVAAPGPLAGAASPAGNPYGSYVSADLPGYQDRPAPGYLPGRSGPGHPGQPQASTTAAAASITARIRRPPIRRGMTAGQAAGIRRCPRPSRPGRLRAA